MPELSAISDQHSALSIQHSAFSIQLWNVPLSLMADG
jgi:hypothetical protein